MMYDASFGWETHSWSKGEINFDRTGFVLPLVFQAKKRLGFLRSICPKMWEMSTKIKCQNHQEK